MWQLTEQTGLLDFTSDYLAIFEGCKHEAIKFFTKSHFYDIVRSDCYLKSNGFNYKLLTDELDDLNESSQEGFNILIFKAAAENYKAKLSIKIYDTVIFIHLLISDYTRTRFYVIALDKKEIKISQNCKLYQKFNTKVTSLETLCLNAIAKNGHLQYTLPPTLSIKLESLQPIYR